MKSAAAAALAFLLFAVSLRRTQSLQICTNSEAPMLLKSPLAFCSNTGNSSCCSAVDDANISAQFASMNLSVASPCGAVIKSILCSKCDQYAGEIYQIEQKTPRRSPILCDSTVFSSPAQNATAADYCSTVWNACSNVAMPNSPFIALQKSAGGTAMLSDTWKSSKDFCSAVGGTTNNNSVCFNGVSGGFNANETTTSPTGMCLEMIGNRSFINMAPHPDGSNRAFFATQPGKIFLATLPEPASGEKMAIDMSSPFLDITDEVHYENEFGLLGIAFHPKFAENGRFFVSYSCDKTKSSTCSGKCACNSDIGCDPANLTSSNGAQPCQFSTVIAEYSAKTSGSPSAANTANPVEVKRIFTMGLPSTTSHGGQLLFGPGDGYLYLIMGFSGPAGDPLNFAQTKKSLLGKVLRFDVDSVPSADTLALNLWGNYSVPPDNPFYSDSSFAPEVWAMGFRNPWRCSFDSQRPLYLYCADVGQKIYEEVNLVTKAGNYGWNIFDGYGLANSTAATKFDNKLDNTTYIFPVMGYYHDVVNNRIGSASITGGYVYRGTTDPCLTGKYVFADLYAKSIWYGLETPESSGTYTQNPLNFTCDKNSPVPCAFAAGASYPSLGYIFSFGEDNRKDLFLLTSSGVYRVVTPSLCNYTCPLESATKPPPGNKTPSSHAFKQEHPLITALVLVLSCIFMLSSSMHRR